MTPARMVDTVTLPLVVFSLVEVITYGPPLRVGASLTATRVTTLAAFTARVFCPPLAVPPLSRTLLRVTMREAPLGASLSLR
ncbi:hypothetical protein D3C76_1385450 [compost metagenome]